MIELVVRLVFSLAVVIGLLLLLAKLGSRRFRGRDGALVQVVHRQALSRSSSVTVVTVGGRVLVLGTTEQQISVLAELEPDEIEAQESTDAAAADDENPEPRSGVVAAFRPALHAVLPGSAATIKPATAAATRPASTTGPLAGSVLSPDTWRQALAAATRRTS
ncbi:MAG: flagellar biosynthetic protein FliO [Nocardioidaceae bacterium]